jgi:hypothetical protein
MGHCLDGVTLLRQLLAPPQEFLAPGLLGVSGGGIGLQPGGQLQDQHFHGQEVGILVGSAQHEVDAVDLAIDLEIQQFAPLPVPLLLRHQRPPQMQRPVGKDAELGFISSLQIGNHPDRAVFRDRGVQLHGDALERVPLARQNTAMDPYVQEILALLLEIIPANPEGGGEKKHAPQKPPDPEPMHSSILPSPKE